MALRKDAHLNIRISSDDLQLVRQRAAAANLSQSEYIIRQALAGEGLLARIDELESKLDKLVRAQRGFQRAGGAR